MTGQLDLGLRWQPSTGSGWVDLAAARIYWNAAGRTATKKRRPRPTPIPRHAAVIGRVAAYVIDAGWTVRIVPRGSTPATEAASLTSTRRTSAGG